MLEIIPGDNRSNYPNLISGFSDQQGLNKPSNGRKIAVISGAGIAGLAASFELNAKGFDVYIAEKYKDFSRFNFINLYIEVQEFLRKFKLLDEFETSVAARIKEHKCLVYGNKGLEALPSSDVSDLQFDDSLPKDYKKFDSLFMLEGVYSVQIKDLQALLAEKATKLGVRILNEAEVKMIDHIPGERVSKLEIIQKNSSNPPLTLEPDLFFIAEGAHSTTVNQFKMGNEENDIVKNDCTGENWIFGNLEYSGNKTYVVSVVDASQKTLQIANVIFNAKNGIANVAVTSDENPQEVEIEKLILGIAKKVFDYEGIKDEPKILDKVKKPVHIINRMASNCSSKNVFRIGDAVGHSSPLAGLGGTLGLTLVPCTIERLLEDDHMKLEGELHKNFKEFSQAYVTRWINKSQFIKGIILDIFKTNRSSSEAPELLLEGK